MFADLIDLIGRDIRPFMTFGTRIGFSGHLDGELVSGVAGSTRSHTAVGVYPPHPLIGPSCQDWELHLAEIRIFGLGTLHPHDGAVAIVTGFGIGLGVGLSIGDFPVFIDRDAVGDLHEIVVHGILVEVPIGVGHEILTVLFHLDGMTRCAVLRGNDHMDLIPFMCKGILVLARIYGVALGAADRHVCPSLRCLGERSPPFQGWLCQCFLEGDVGMSTPLPVCDCAGGGCTMTFQARAGGRTGFGCQGRGGADHGDEYRQNHHCPHANLLSPAIFLR